MAERFLPTTPVQVADHASLGLHAVAENGESGTVRRVYQVGEVLVAVLTSGDQQAPEQVWAEALDVLGLNGEPPREAGFRLRQDEFADLEVLICGGSAEEAQIERYSELRTQITRYLDAPALLHLALIEQVQAGDRVVYAPERLLGTVVDPDPVPGLPIRCTMTVRLDSRDQELAPIPTPWLWPTLGLV